jgi:hypothetical protein
MIVTVGELPWSRRAVARKPRAIHEPFPVSFVCKAELIG